MPATPKFFSPRVQAVVVPPTPPTPSSCSPRVPASESLPNFSNSLIDNGTVELCEELGSGAFGKVYRAVEHIPMPRQYYDNTATHSRPASCSNFASVYKPASAAPRPRSNSYAVKCLAKHWPLGSRKAQMQRRELDLHRRVSNHDSIVSMHRVLSDKDHLYVFLDLHTGGDLFTAITEKNRYADYRAAVLCGDDARIKRDFIQLIDAVQHCHSLGVYHRDIKPENILISEDGERLYLADFGLSTTAQDSRTFGCGSPFYMSPECLGHDFNRTSYSTPPADVWAMGVILLNMISGRNPWRLASVSDHHFALFIHTPELFLCSVMPVSQEVNLILSNGVLRFDATMRVDLDELRRQISSVCTFYQDSEIESLEERDIVDYASKDTVVIHEAVVRTPIIHRQDSELVLDPRLPSQVAVIDDTTRLGRSSSIMSSSQSSLCRAAYALHLEQNDSLSSAGELYAAYCRDGSLSSSSDSSNLGPLTPGTYAVDSLGMDLAFNTVPEIHLDDERGSRDFKQGIEKALPHTPLDDHIDCDIGLDGLDWAYASQKLLGLEDIQRTPRQAQIASEYSPQIGQLRQTSQYLDLAKLAREPTTDETECPIEHVHRPPADNMHYGHILKASAAEMDRAMRGAKEGSMKRAARRLGFGRLGVLF